MWPESETRFGAMPTGVGPNFTKTGGNGPLRRPKLPRRPPSSVRFPGSCIAVNLMLQTNQSSASCGLGVRRRKNTTPVGRCVGHHPLHRPSLHYDSHLHCGPSRCLYARGRARQARSVWSPTPALKSETGHHFGETVTREGQHHLNSCMESPLAKAANSGSGWKNPGSKRTPSRRLVLNGAMARYDSSIARLPCFAMYALWLIRQHKIRSKAGVTPKAWV